MTSPLNRPRTLIAVSGCVAALVIAELLSGAGTVPSLDPVPPVPLATVTQPRVLTPIESFAVDAVQPAILARPLFAPGRRPPRAQASVPATALAEPPIKLVGTILSDRGRIAFLEVAGKSITRREGETVATSRIVEIEQGEVRLLPENGEMRVLRLAWGMKIAPTPAPSAPEPRPFAARKSR